MRLYEERNGCCEACRGHVAPNAFDVHHTNYDKGDDPAYLRVMCRPCHDVVTRLTAVVSWFEGEAEGFANPLPMAAARRRDKMVEQEPQPEPPPRRALVNQNTPFPSPYPGRRPLGQK